MKSKEMSHKIPENLMLFARGLRRAGLKIGASEILNTLECLKATGFGEKADFYWILHANFVKKNEDTLIFQEAFNLFFQKRGLQEKMMSLLMPQTTLPPKEQETKAGAARIEEAFSPRDKKTLEREELETNSQGSSNSIEILQQKDFAQMSAGEILEALSTLKKLKLPQEMRKMRRYEASNKGKLPDMRRALKANESLTLPMRRPQVKPSPLVILLDISGSMSQYSRIMLHFAHTLIQLRKNVSLFTFGTRLTPLTRALRAKDPDEALMAATKGVQDWAGGTRLATTLGEFNRNQARRVLGRGATVLLITDGLERDNLTSLEEAISRLHRSSKRLIWLNPLLRYESFEPKARGIALMLKHVDEFRPVHNLNSLKKLVKALN
jgi:uncharacterized protein